MSAALENMTSLELSSREVVRSQLSIRGNFDLAMNSPAHDTIVPLSLSKLHVTSTHNFWDTLQARCNLPYGDDARKITSPMN